MNQKQTVSPETVLKGIKPIDKEAVKSAKAHWDRVAKPLNSLGVLEEDICRIAGVKRREEFSLDKKCIVIMCADNGIVAEGVTQTGQDVTAAVAKNMAARRSCVCLMAACAGAEVLPVDVGIAADMTGTGISFLDIGTYKSLCLQKEKHVPDYEWKAEQDIQVQKAVLTSLKDGFDFHSPNLSMAHP